jgi:two-component system, chemotaxis family, sensor kinase CheA
MLEVLYATVLEPDLVGQVVDVPPERVRLIEKNGAVMPLAGRLPHPPPNRWRRPRGEAAAQEKGGESGGKGTSARAPRPPVPAKPAPGPARPPTPAEESSRAAAAEAVPAIETTIRLNVTLLDSLMTLAGELVLSRNQLNESLSRRTSGASAPAPNGSAW